MLCKGSLMSSAMKCFICLHSFHGQKKEDLLDMERKLNVLREGSKSKCFQTVIGARALKTKEGIMRNHNRKRQSVTGQRNR